MKTSFRTLFSLLLLTSLLLAAAGCANPFDFDDTLQTPIISEETDTSEAAADSSGEDASENDADTSETAGDTSGADTSEAAADSSGEGASESSAALSEGTFDLSQVPDYSDEAYVEINGNVPYFNTDELTTTSYESYSDLDSLGRCGTAEACIGIDLMPTEERGSIGSVRPTGWHTVKYDGIDGNYLYNRCHLIGYQLSGENANEENLITGTRYLNVDGMLPFENDVADYVEDTGNHVMYRVTPVFEGDNLVASGVLMEAYSVEDDGAGVSFCVYCYNVQPGIEIDYETGESEGPEYTGS